MVEEALIRLESVVKGYHMGEVVVRALRGLQLSVMPGELMVLLGPSGCGKTTVLNLIGGLDKPTSGHVLVPREDIAGYDEGRLTGYRRHKVGFIFRFFNLIPTLTAAENIEVALANRPAMLLCDETTGNLDVDTGQQVLEVVSDLNRNQGTTIVLVTHNTAIAPMGDRIVHLRNGSVDRIEEIDSPREVSELAW